jgi:NitT/TauT family transport system substrate-binding protein
MPIKLTENFRAVFYAPFYAIQALGFYARESVDVELMNSPAPAAAEADLLSGMIDLSWGGPMRVMKAHDKDPSSPLVCFCEVAARDPFFLVGTGDRPEFRLADLAKLRFGTVSEVPTPWLCLQQDLRQNGIDPDRLERTVNRTMAGNFEALRNRELDVVQMFEPYVSMALQAGIGKILHAASTRGPTVYTTFLATRDSIERNRTSFCRDDTGGSPHAVLAMRAQRGGAGRRRRTVLSGRGARPAGELASALSRCRPLGPSSRCVAGGIRTVGRMPPVRRFYLPNARL